MPELPEADVATATDSDPIVRTQVGSTRITLLGTAHVSRKSAEAVTRMIDSGEFDAIILAAAGAGEQSGTTTNLEGRVTTVADKVTTTGTARPDWMIAAELSLAVGPDLGFATLEELREVDVEDLLGRDPVPPKPELCKACIEIRSVLVTGAGPIGIRYDSCHD